MTRLAAAVATLTLLATPAAASSERIASQPQRVVVKHGDTLSALFADTPGGPYRAAYVNDISNPDLITPGMTLVEPRTDGRRWQPKVSRQWTRSSSSSSSVGSSAPASPERSGGDSLNWTALYQCESGNNPRAVSPSGKYRGLAQWDLATWHSLGMSGDPIDHSYAVQDAAARRLYAQRGRSPWPHCGSRL